MYNYYRELKRRLFISETYPNGMAFSSAGAAPLPFSDDMIKDFLPRKRLTIKGEQLRITGPSRGDVRTRNWVTRHRSMQKKGTLIAPV